MTAGLVPLLLAPVVWVLLRVGDRYRSRVLRDLVGPRLAPPRPARGRTVLPVSRVLLAGSLLLAALAFLIPEHRATEASPQVRGVDLVLALDVSRSMRARDVAPDRLERAKREILALAGRVQGDRLALVIFAGDAHLHVPLTQDVLSFASLLAGVGPSDVEQGGTDLGAALQAAGAALPTDPQRLPVVLLLTDGEDLAGTGLQAAKELAERGIEVHALGLGSTRGSKITIEGDQGSAFLRDRAGRDVVSTLDRVGLAAIARATGGRYRDVPRSETVSTALYDEVIRPAAESGRVAPEAGATGVSYQIPLAFALLLGLLAVAVGSRGGVR